MNVLIVGASRGVGRELVKQSLAAGHSVTALARHLEGLPVEHERLRKVRGNVLDPGSLSGAMAGQEAVCFTVGIATPWGQPDVFSKGTERLLEAMKSYGVRRLVCVTGIGAGDSKGHGGFLYDCIAFPLLLKSVYADKDRQEALIRAADVDWTIVRPGFLWSGPLTRRYRALTDLSGVTAGWISRADVAHFMLEELSTNRHLRQTPLLT